MNEIDVQLRDKTGKEGAAKARRDGNIPAVLYGLGSEPKAIAINDVAFQKFLRTTTGQLTFVALNIAGSNGTQKEHVIIKAIQRHPVFEQIIHIDFMRVSLEDKLTINIPIETHGSSPGIKLGGMLQQATRQVQVRCLPARIPPAAMADISGLEIGNTFTAGQLQLPEEVELLTPADMVVLSVTITHYEEEATAVDGEAAAAPGDGESTQPEVIGEKERDERRAKKDEGKDTKDKEKQEIKDQKTKEGK